MRPNPAANLQIRVTPINREIVISSVPNGQFSVAVIPRFDGEPRPVLFKTMNEANGYAGGLRLVRGWPVSIVLDDASHG